MSFLHTATFEESSVKSAQHLTPWKAALAVRVSRKLLGKPGSVYLADLHKLDDLFPDEPKPTGRRDRLNRLYEVPVEVDGLIFQVVKEGSQQRIYGKTRRLTASYGDLNDLAEARADVTLHNPVPSTVRHLLPSDSTAAPPPIARTQSPVAPDSVEIDALRTRVNDLEAALLSYGVEVDSSKFTISQDRFEQIGRRLLLLDINIGNIIRGLEGYVPGFKCERQTSFGSAVIVEPLPTLENEQ